MPSLNTLPILPTARQPRGTVKLAGVAVQGWISFDVDNNQYRSADTFTVEFAVSMLPAQFQPLWFAAQTTIPVEIFAGFPQDAQKYTDSELNSLIYGNADEVHYDPVAGTIKLTGRDLTALLIDTKTSEHFANQTSSQIATTLAKRHGLTPVVTTTSTLSGDYYKQDHDRMTQQQSEWDLLTFLANVENFVVYVKGQELHFEPAPVETGNHYVLAWDAPTNDRAFPIFNGVSLEFSRALTIAKGVTVEVHSWNAKQKKGFSAYFPKAAKGAKPGQSAAQSQTYRYTIAGLTQDAAQQRAQSLYKQIVAHEMKLTARMPADNILTCDKTILVQGTGTKFDQVYYPDSITRTMHINDGYTMNISAKNTSPELEAAQQS